MCATKNGYLLFNLRILVGKECYIHEASSYLLVFFLLARISILIVLSNVICPLIFMFCRIKSFTCQFFFCLFRRLFFFGRAFDSSHMVDDI